MVSPPPFLTKTMARVSNSEAGRGFTHKFTVDLDDYREISGNATQTIPLVSAGDGVLIVSRAFTVVTSDISADGAVSVSIGNSGDVDAYLLASVQGSAPSTSAINNGVAFNDGTTDNTVNTVVDGGDLIATLTLASGDWSSNNGGRFVILLHVIETNDLL